MNVNSLKLLRKDDELITFEQYFIDRNKSICDDIIRMALRTGQIKVDRISIYIEYPQEVCLEGISFEKVMTSHIEGARLEFCAVIAAKIRVSEWIQEALAEDTIYQRYMLSGEYNLRDMNCTFDSTIATVIDKNVMMHGRSMDRYLTPYIYSHQLNEIAAELRDKYLPHDGRKRTLSEKAKCFMRKAGLRIQYEHLSADKSVKGKIIFDRDRIIVYDDSGISYQKTVPGNTVLIDREACGENSFVISETIIHECIHFLKDECFYRLQRLFNDEMEMFTCTAFSEANEPTTQSTYNSQIRWIEWQASELTNKFILEDEETKQTIFRLKYQYQQMNGRPLLTSTRRIVDDLARTFEVPAEFARRKMVSLGFTEAAGISLVVDGKQIPDYCVSPEKQYLYRNRIFSFPVTDLVQEYIDNKKLKSILDNGRYIYLESHLVLDSPKYVMKQQNGKPCLTWYAREHIEECCISFKADNRYKYGTYMPNTLLKTELNDTAFMAYSQFEPKALDQKSIEFLVTAKEVFECRTFEETLNYHMKRCKVTAEELAARSGLSEHTISDYRNTRKVVSMTVESIIAICIALHLEREFSNDLLMKAEFNIHNIGEMSVYCFLLNNLYMLSLEECNVYLAKFGFPPLPNAIPKNERIYVRDQLDQLKRVRNNKQVKR